MAPQFYRYPTIRAAFRRTLEEILVNGEPGGLAGLDSRSGKMGETKILILDLPAEKPPLPPLGPGIRRTRPRDYLEWRALRRWGKLPAWEDVFPGYLMREAREIAGLTQKQMAERLKVSQQAIAQAERPTSNPTLAFLKAWAEATGSTLDIALRATSPKD
jgi:DNA-binding XRE family transcriptional regulator